MPGRVDHGHACDRSSGEPTHESRTRGAGALCSSPRPHRRAPPKFDAAKFGWHTDYAAAKAEAKRTGKPIFLVFRCEP